MYYFLYYDVTFWNTWIWSPDLLRTNLKSYLLEDLYVRWINFISEKCRLSWDHLFAKLHNLKKIVGNSCSMEKQLQRSMHFSFNATTWSWNIYKCMHICTYAHAFIYLRIYEKNIKKIFIIVILQLYKKFIRSEFFFTTHRIF